MTRFRSEFRLSMFQLLSPLHNQTGTTSNRGFFTRPGQVEVDCFLPFSGINAMNVWFSFQIYFSENMRLKGVDERDENQRKYNFTKIYDQLGQGA